jgi:hypothetical protein
MENFLVTKLHQQFIKEHFFEWSFKGADASPSKALFEELDHPVLLHFLADIYNWDDGSIILEWILDSPLCSRSTANLLFWRASPDFYLSYDIYNLESCPDYNRDPFRVLSKIVEKYNSGQFSDINIELDPSTEIEEISETNPKWTFPKGTYDHIHGINMIVEP